MVFVLEDIEQSNDIRMLAHLENFDFSSLQLNISHCHLLLGHDLDCNVFASFLMSGGLDQTELTLTKCLLHFIVVCETGISNNLLNGLYPLNLLFSCL